MLSYNWKKCSQCNEIKLETLEFFPFRNDTKKFRNKCLNCYSKNKFPKISKEYLVEEYCIKKKTLKEIGGNLGVSDRTISSYLKKYNIGANIVEISKEYLLKEYSKNKRTIQNIATELNLGTTTICKFLIKYQIPINEIYIDKEYLVEEYVNKRRTLESIAKEFNVSRSVINKFIKKYNIETNKSIFSKNFLLEEYVHNGKSAIELSKIYNVDKSTINKNLNKHEIPIQYNDSVQQKEILGWLESNGFECLNNYTLENKELDIYIPKMNLAIEFHGLYWHSYNPYHKITGNSNKNQHLEKTKLCEKYNIKLFQIFEDEWENKKEIWKSIILSKLGIFKERIYARKCIIKEVNKTEASEFLNINHLQGSFYSGEYYGLYFNEVLMCVMNIGPYRYKTNTLELYRFATKLNTQVVGGFSKLLKYVNKSMITYSDLRYSTGNIYKNFGEFLGSSEPNYWYTKDKKKLSRYQCQKHKLPKLLGDKFNPNETEKENMFRNGYRILYDCGNLKYILRN